MFELERNYKIKLCDEIYYTGTIIEEEEHLIKVKTFRNEIIIINKTNIARAEELYRIENDKPGC